MVACRGRDAEDISRAVEKWCADVLTVAVDRSTVWSVLPDNHPPLSELEVRLRAMDQSIALAASELVGADRVGPSRARLLQTLSTLDAGTAVLPRSAGPDGMHRAIAAFLQTASEEVRLALVAYLRHRGQWEQASKALDLHRNTLRYRVNRARDLLGLDLDDPDIAALTWLALRAEGVA